MPLDWKKRRTLPTSAVRRVAILGGTHGNETNGVHLAKHFMRNPDEVRRPSFETEVMLCNVGAVEANSRYVEEDLNRCYLAADLADDAKATTSLERKRAREIDAALGPKASNDPRVDFIIDLHNTTANTGVALLMAPDDDFAHEMAAHLSTLDSSVTVVNWNQQGDWPLTASVARSGMTFEVGACPWGCLVPDLFVKSRRLVLALLDHIERHNAKVAAGLTEMVQAQMPVFESIGISIDYPKTADGEITAMAHPDLQGNDFREIKDGDNLFMTFTGESRPFSREAYKVPAERDPVYAFFVNEAAYYEKGIALMLAGRVEHQFSALKDSKL